MRAAIQSRISLSTQPTARVASFTRLGLPISATGRNFMAQIVRVQTDTVFDTVTDFPQTP